LLLLEKPVTYFWINFITYFLLVGIFLVGRLLLRCPKLIAGTQAMPFVKENLTHVHGQIICHRKFVIKNLLLHLGL